METKKFTLIAVIFFAIGFLIAPAVALLHVPQETAQVFIGLNWISGGLAFLALATFKGELP